MSIKYYKFFDLLQRKGLTKGEFSKMANLSSATMAKLSNHKVVSGEVIVRICKVLNCQPADIMEYIHDEEN